jgi:hypothetical protein
MAQNIDRFGSSLVRPRRLGTGSSVLSCGHGRLVLTLPGVNARGFLVHPVDLLVDVATFIVEISLFPSVNFGVPRRI